MVPENSNSLYVFVSSNYNPAALPQHAEGTLVWKVWLLSSGLRVLNIGSFPEGGKIFLPIKQPLNAATAAWT